MLHWLHTWQPLADWLVAAGTIGLALATVYLGWSARDEASAVREETAVVSQQVILQQRQLAESQRPVLVPVMDSTPILFRGGTVFDGPTVVENPLDRDDLPDYGAVHLPVENVGSGPAINAQGDLTMPRGTASVVFPTEAIGVGRRGVVTFVKTRGSVVWDGLEKFTGLLVYFDVAGTQYETEIEFDSGNRAFRSTLGPSTPQRLQP